MCKGMAQYNFLSVINELFTVLKLFGPGKSVCVFHTEFIAKILNLVFLWKCASANIFFYLKIFTICIKILAMGQAA